ncbi:hypothetical protein H2200_005820 [Cladophialophora chaetospira]|uniref:AB hydrolase-1 domain-containing protein n=1 Tax=Cladophialophora chaetospira TaxID=386627 RepID=A0AA39CHY9_9EURO|nr:hypothetical protein H2200_005820 [Cladophialophora chaetospira]
MGSTSLPSDFELPPRIQLGSRTSIPGPSHDSFVARLGRAFPEPQFLESDLGTTAIYDLPAPSGHCKRPVLVIHGANTPALGMLGLAKSLQARDNDTHVVLFDLWGHGLSSTPLVPHSPHIFHFQILQILSYMQWTKAHFLGFSFGGSTLVRFANSCPWAVSSAALLAPAGLLRTEQFNPTMRELLPDSKGREAELRQSVLDWLEGGPLIIPDDWKERVKNGEAVAEVLRDWELQEHSGYPYSVVSLFRSGAYGCEDDFRKFAQLSTKKIGVLGELDDVCNKSQLVELGFEDVQVVPRENHGFVRSSTAEVARIVHRFWEQDSLDAVTGQLETTGV